MNIIQNVIDLTLGFSIILKILLIAIGAYIIIKLLYLWVNHIENKYDIDMTVVYVLNDIFKYIILIIAIAWILEIFGINIKGIILSLGIAGVAVGIAAKDIVSNFLSGLFVLGDKSIRVGDVISIGDMKGTVQKIGFRTTTLINQDNHTITVPNGMFNANSYKKYLPLEDYRIDVYSVLPHNVRLDEFEKDVKEAILKYDWVNKEHPIIIKGDFITEDGPKMLVSTWITSYEMLDPGKVIIMDEINQIIYEKYNKPSSKKVDRRNDRKDQIAINQEKLK